MVVQGGVIYHSAYHKNVYSHKSLSFSNLKGWKKVIIEHDSLEAIPQVKDSGSGVNWEVEAFVRDIREPKAYFSNLYVVYVGRNSNRCAY